jgi:hypothetical protein
VSDANRMRVSDETDPVLMHHWVDRWDCGMDRYDRAAIAATLHDLIDRIDRATGGAGISESPPDVTEDVAELFRDTGEAGA